MVSIIFKPMTVAEIVKALIICELLIVINVSVFVPMTYLIIHMITQRVSLEKGKLIDVSPFTMYLINWQSVINI